MPRERLRFLGTPMPRSNLLVGELRIAPSKVLAPDVDTQEVQEYIVPANSLSFLLDEICHGDHRLRPHLHRGLLASLSDHGLLHRLSNLDGPSGDTPPTLRRRVS